MNRVYNPKTSDEMKDLFIILQKSIPYFFLMK